jgi:hypothetical protein
MDDDETFEVIRQAERIVWAASWHLQEQSVLEQLAGTRGLACARLEPHSDVIQLVAYDGEHLGHVRREDRAGQGERWVAVLRHDARQIGTYGSADTAAAALAWACGKTTGQAWLLAYGGLSRAAVSRVMNGSRTSATIRCMSPGCRLRGSRPPQP